MRHPDTLRSKSKTHTVTHAGTGYTVTSGHTGAVYHVTQLPGTQAHTCDCKWSEYRPQANQGACGCSHVLAVIAFEQGERQRTTAVHNSYETAQRQHRQILAVGDGLLVTTRKAG